MPNIVIVGYNDQEAADVQTKVDGVMRGLGKAPNAITTVLPAGTKACHNANRAPYLIVRHTDLKEACDIATALHEALKTDIEYEVIGGFLTA